MPRYDTYDIETPTDPGDTIEVTLKRAWWEWWRVFARTPVIVQVSDDAGNVYREHSKNKWRSYSTSPARRITVGAVGKDAMKVGTLVHSWPQWPEED